MSLEQLTGPIREGNPTGEDCAEDAQFLEAIGCVEYVAQCAKVEELRRTSVLFEKADEQTSKFHKEKFEREDMVRTTLEARAKAAFPRSDGPLAIAGKVAARCESLLAEKGKDLRVVAALALADTRLEGVDGLIRNVKLFELLLELYPDSVHPVVDREDPGDFRRVRALEGLSTSPGLRDVLRESALIAPGRGPALRFRDAEVIAGVLKPDALGQGIGRREDAIMVVRQSLAEEAGTRAEEVSEKTTQEWLVARRASIDSATDSFVRLFEKLAPQRSLADPVPQMLRAMSSLLGSLAEGMVVPEAIEMADRPAGDGRASETALLAEELPDATTTSIGGPTGARTPTLAPLLALPRLQTRDDARQAILQVATFIDMTMPGHPAPLFLRRAEKLLAANDFFEIIADIFEPNQTQHVEKVTGQRASPSPS